MFSYVMHNFTYVSTLDLAHRLGVVIAIDQDPDLMIAESTVVIAGARGPENIIDLVIAVVTGVIDPVTNIAKRNPRGRFFILHTFNVILKIRNWQ